MRSGCFPRGAVVSALAILAVLAASFAPAHAADDFPSRPIRLIVGFAAGGGNDLFARVVADKASAILGQAVVVENRPGARGRLSGDMSPTKLPMATRFWSARPARCRSRPRSIPISNITRPRRWCRLR